MNGECDAMEIESDLPEFTFSEIIQLEKLLKVMRDEPIDENKCREISAKFNRTAYRAEKSPIQWAQVQNWFRDKQLIVGAKVESPTTEANLASLFKEAKSASRNRAKLASPSSGAVVSKAAVLRKPVKAKTISVNEAAAELSNLMFEARSAKDSAWFDVGSFLTYKFLYTGELVVRVRFANFGKEEDEWVSVKRAIRDRSLPLEPSECDKVGAGDLVLCFRENPDHALYCDAFVVEVERIEHGSDACTCIFTVRYENDSTEAKVKLGELCCRPTSASNDSKLLSLDSLALQNERHHLVDDDMLVE